MTACDRFEREGLERFVAGEPLDPHLDSCPECRAALASYQALAAALAREAKAPPAGWEAKVWAKLPEVRARTPTPWPIFAGLAATLAALAVFFVRGGGPDTLALTSQVERGHGPLVRGATSPTSGEGQSAAPGDVLHVLAKVPRGKAAELRVYRGADELVFECSKSPSCTRTKDGLEARVPLERAGTYRTLLLDADGSIPPTTGSLDGDFAAGKRAGAATESSPVDVL